MIGVFALRGPSSRCQQACVPYIAHNSKTLIYEIINEGRPDQNLIEHVPEMTDAATIGIEIGAVRLPVRSSTETPAGIVKKKISFPSYTPPSFS